MSGFNHHAFVPDAPRLSPVMRGRPTKFTPERIEQIRNLVERGRSREEIAEIIGCTVGTLQVTCSKLGVSLRRPRFDMAMGLKRPRPIASTPKPVVAPIAPAEPIVAPVIETPPLPSAPAKSGPFLALRMEYRGITRDTSLALDSESICALILEAEHRGIRLGELVAMLIVETVRRNLLHYVSNGTKTDVDSHAS
jgi:hypothetical protein